VRNANSNGLFKAITSYSGKDKLTPVDITVDPTDWRRIYVLDSGGHIWFSSDGDKDPSVPWTWTNLANPAGSPNVLANLPGATRLRTIRIVRRSKTSPAVVLVGGLGGIFRKIDSGPWTAF